MFRYLLIVIILFSNSSIYAQHIYELTSAEVEFHSDAPQELIQAKSQLLKGIVDINSKTFAFKVGIASFVGFNSPLQREHFNENYMETNIFSEASFRGKIIEDINFSVDGVYTVRAKGKLKIHGIEQDRIIKSNVTVRNGKMSLQADFMVSLADHDIKIPHIVSEKLAPDINVSVKATLLPKK